MNIYKNLALFLIVLIVIFIAITYLKNLNTQEKTVQDIAEEKSKTCDETCKTSNCLYGCYSVKINVAIAEKDIGKCSEIKNDEIKQSCLDQVNLVLKNCNDIKNQNLKALCQ
ncbi:MAG: hypothetical protein AABW45_02755 [Nanoarchaeota archaeon]